MKQYERIFEKTLAEKEEDSKVPVTCSLQNFYESIYDLIQLNIL